MTSAGDVLAMNFLLDRSADGWARELAGLRAQVGNCETNAPIVATGALSGDFMWRCEHGRLKGSLLLAPTRPPRINRWASPEQRPERDRPRSVLLPAMSDRFLSRSPLTALPVEEQTGSWSEPGFAPPLL